MKLYQTRPGVAPALGYDPSPRLLESLALPLRYAGCKSSLMTYLGQAIAQAKTSAMPTTVIWVSARLTGTITLAYLGQ